MSGDIRSRAKVRRGAVRLLLIFLFPVLVSVDALAQPDNEWRTTEGHIGEIMNSEGMTAEEKCQKTWDIVWPLAKAGNVEARYELLMDMYYLQRVLPGRSDDKISQLRDFVILTIYSLGAKRVTEEIQQSHLRYTETLQRLWPTLFLDSAFQKCMSETPSQACALIASQERLIPTFDNYAAEIDRSIEQGRSSTCAREQ